MVEVGVAKVDQKDGVENQICTTLLGLTSEEEEEQKKWVEEVQGEEIVAAGELGGQRIESLKCTCTITICTTLVCTPTLRHTNAHSATTTTN